MSAFFSDATNLLIVLGILALLIIIYFVARNHVADQKSRDRDNDMHDGVGDPITNQNRDEKPLGNTINKAEPEAPVYDSDGLPPELSPAPAPRQTQPAAPEMTPSEPVQTELAIEEPEQTQPQTCQGRLYPYADDGIEATVLLTPKSGVFDRDLLLTVSDDIAAKEFPFKVRVDFFNARTRRWDENPQDNFDCTQIYLSMPLANRHTVIDEMTASNFFTMAQQLSIHLDADETQPEGDSLFDRVANVCRVIETFGQALSVKVVTGRELTEDEVSEAALGCGFVAENGRFEKQDDLTGDSLFILQRSQLPNEIEVLMNVPMISPAAEPLTMLMSMCNDLACRLDGALTDMFGAPITSASVALIHRDLRQMQDEMAKIGVSAGSERARRIFSVYG